MSGSFSKRVWVRIISFSLAAAVLVVGAGLCGFKLMSRYKTTIEYKYQLALNNLSDYMSNIKTTLEKGLYANTPSQQQPLLAKLMTMSEGAKASLSQLPISGDQSISIQKYFAQVGDFSSFALGKLAKDDPLTEDERNNFKVLYEYACQLDLSISDIASTYGDGSADIGAPITLDGNLENIGAQVEQLTLDSGFREMNEGFTDYPTMIYDGPFSDHIEQKAPALTSDKTAISEEQALVIAADFIDCDKDELSLDGKSEGNLPTYNFSGKDMYITVTQRGGIVDIYENYAAVGNTSISYTDALKKAKEFLIGQRMESFTESYYMTEDNICTINFAYTENDIIYYSDLIKVSINMDTGKIAGYCATGYIMNHTKRDVSSPKLNEADARQMLSPNLTVEKTKTALIPTAGKNEVLCYEFTCSSGNDTVLVYINCDTGMEEQIYIVLQQDNGVLVI